MNDVTPQFLADRGQLDIALATLLVNGATKPDLEAALSMPGEAKAVIDIRRMNLVGSLRAMGFEVTGGRRGGAIYRVIDWRDPSTVPSPTTADFTPDQKETLGEIRSLPKLTTSQATIDHHFHSLWGALAESPIPGHAHEKSILQLLCYDISKNVGFVIRNGPRLGVIIQRFVEKPAFKLLPMTLTFEEATEWADKLSTVSFRNVKMSYISPEWAPELKKQGYSIESSAEAVYDLDRFANRPGTWLNKRALETLRSLKRSTRLYEIEDGDALIGQVIEEWRKVNESKQRQLAIARDYFSFMIGSESRITFLAMRNSSPVGVHILDPVCGVLHDKVVCQVTEKSLNYRQSPEGHSGTSDFVLQATAEALLVKGYTTLNVGHVYGSADGLAERKLKLADEILTIQSATLPKIKEA